MIGGGRIVICDYKNGAGVPVEAERNSQMMLYALGALASFRPIYGDTITTAHLVIIQPHAGGVKEWEISVEELTRWGHEVVAPRAKTALEGAEPACPGDWCRFCKGKSQCAARAKQMLEAGKQYQMAPAAGSEKLPPKYDGPLLSDEEVGAALSAGAGLVAWYKDLQDYALLACLDGREIPGFKAVEGRGSRDWGDDPDAAFRILQERGVAEAMLYERKPVTAPALEKALGKKLFAEVADGLDERLDSIRIQSAVNAFLRHQAPTNREIFISRYFDFEPIESISARLHMTPNAVKIRLNRMRKKLRSDLQKGGVPI